MLRAAVIVLLIALLPSHARAEAKIALLIGNQAYDPSVGALKNPLNDIALVAQALSRQGFDVLPAIKNAKRTDILGGVRDLVRRLNAAGAGAIGFIYYSGHGAAEKDTNINYLIPVDAQRPGTSIFWDESVKLDDVLRLLDGASSAAKFVVFDACRTELQLPTKDTSKGLLPVAEQQGMFIAYASAPGHTASDFGDKAGPYAEALANELAKPGLDHLALFQNVKEAVYAGSGGAQQPWESNGLVRRVYLTGPATGSPAKSDALATEAERAWVASRESSDPTVLEAFISRFKDSFYADLARVRIDELKKQQTAIVAPPKAPEPATQAIPTMAEPPTPQVERGWLGVKIQNIDEDTAASLGLSEAKGALVTQVTTSGPADEAGIKNGDAILAVNGSKLTSSRDLARQIAGFAPSTKIDVQILRGQKEQSITVKLGQFPKELAKVEPETKSDAGAAPPDTGTPIAVDKLGLKVANGADKDRVVISEVDTSSDAAHKGIKSGDVILEVGGSAVKSTKDVDNAVKEAIKLLRKAVLMRIQSGGEPRFVAVTIQAGLAEEMKKPQMATSAARCNITVGVGSVPEFVLKNLPKEWHGNATRCFKPGAGKTEHFKDCQTCPEMVVVPAGGFTMGAPADEKAEWRRAQQMGLPARTFSAGEVQVRVSIAAPFAVGKYAVTFDEWDACAADGGCNGYEPADQGWGRGNRPVIYVTWVDAKAYVSWLSRKTGKTYRLLSDAEREYVTRAGTTTAFWWGSSIEPTQANYSRRTVPVDSFEPNPWGLYQVHGNVWEWTEDCWNDFNTGNPGDGRARTTGDCSKRVVRGGSWIPNPEELRSASRAHFDTTEERHNYLGFRVARTLDP
jgi:formylglycine-generating enzyme required for sulfatase activity